MEIKKYFGIFVSLKSKKCNFLVQWQKWFCLSLLCALISLPITISAATDFTGSIHSGNNDEANQKTEPIQSKPSPSDIELSKNKKQPQIITKDSKKSEVPGSDVGRVSEGSDTDYKNFFESITSLLSCIIGIVKTIIAATNKSQGAIMVLFTFVLLLLNKKLANETKKIREKDSEPKIEVYLIPARISNMIINMIIRNIGGGAARNIKWKIIADEENLKSKDIPILKMSMFKVMHYLPAKETIEFFFGETVKILSEPKLKPIKIEVSYTNDDGKNKPPEIFELNIEPYEGMQTIGRPTDYEISKSLEAIQKDLHNIATGLSTPQILTQTVEEHKKEKKAELEKNRKYLQDNKSQKTEHRAPPDGTSAALRSRR
ncbi:hypothetical protein [Desulfotignum phosphitoxidans]|jgi:hypothetical protein|uniref:Uncharacterized protein n=1 Tax=Desulfotignum phosphitoxidans DSM 13687 TaxID=1286635 RepID=S0FWR6_9BACT|nr:hypothetical protein [Desulfotignum phosphitoxidans]EMS79142.1 hypothetical protein Dpo_5c00650 [Desulfotignum phosphitoxidans DSM 13687]EMS79155.1 hypothetical protein Dpo_5c00780 [Desulfotignum phosphitoxidans DSM 13687]